MKKTLFVPLAVLLTVLLINTGYAAMWSDNFNGGPQQTWIEYDHGDNSSFNFTNDRYELYTENPDLTNKYIASAVEGLTEDAIIQARIQQVVPGDIFMAGIGLRASLGNDTGYAAIIGSGGGLQIVKRVNGVGTGLGYIPLGGLDATDCWLKFEAIGDMLYAKAWTYGTSEPASWQLTATDTELSIGAGFISLLPGVTGYYFTPARVAFDDVSMTNLCSPSTLTPVSAVYDSTGGGGSVSVEMPNDFCDWTAEIVPPANDWITITSGAAGTGDGTVEYTVDANTDALPRTGSITIAGEPFTVAQAGTGGVEVWSDNFDGGPQQVWHVNDRGDNSAVDFINDRYELYTENNQLITDKYLVSHVYDCVSDGIITARITQIDAVDFIALVGLRGNTQIGTSYFATISSFGNVHIIKRDGVNHEILTSIIGLSGVDPMNCHIKFAAEGDALKAKYWTVGTPEPVEWTLSAIDTDFAFGGSFIGITTGTSLPGFGYIPVSRVAFDDVSLTTDLSGPASLGTVPSIPDTGQTKCYDADGNELIPCPGPGQAFYGQDVQYQPQHPRSYTKLGHGGVELSPGATLVEDGGPWIMVRDNVTGLIWEVKQDMDGTPDYANHHDADNTYTWYDPNPETNGGDSGTPGNGITTFDTKQFIDSLNDDTYGGFDDWRMPTVKELQTIRNLGTYNPAVDTAWFPGTNTSWSLYWSSTPDAGAEGPLDAYVVDFYDGRDNDDHKSSSNLVRAVRGEKFALFDNAIIPGRIVDNGDGTVTDTAAGLMWQQETAPGTYTWQDALAYADILNLAGYSDWRLPNQNELKTIADLTRWNPAIDPELFPNTIAWYYYSSTTDVADDEMDYAWVVDFYDGDDNQRWKAGSNNYVRAVRGGQFGSLDQLIIFTPQQASSWNIGSIMPIRWKTEGLGANVKISLSRQGGKDDSFETITESTANDGQYDWVVAGSASVNCVIKIEQADNPSNWSTEGLFAILDPDFADAEIFYIHEWGHDDATGDDYTSMVKAAFNDSGKFKGETIIHSEGGGGIITGSYTFLNGVITVTLSSGPDLEFRISPDGEKIAGVTAHAPESGIYNEVLRIGIKQSSLNNISGTYYFFGWGHEDEGNFSVVYLNKVIFDGLGGYTSESIYDSEGDSGTKTGEYTISNGLITFSDEDETFLIRVSPDGENLAGINADMDNENIIVGMREAPVSNITGTFYFHNWGHEDETGYTCTSMGKIIFDGAGGFISETLIDSEGDDLGMRTGSYTIENGFINFSWEFEDDPPDEGKILFSPDGKTFAGITTQAGNENLLFAVEESCLSGFDSDDGDINCDGNVDLSDAILVLQLMVGMNPTQAINKTADVNGDNKLGMEEVIYILETVAGVR